MATLAVAACSGSPSSATTAPSAAALSSATAGGSTDPSSVPSSAGISVAPLDGQIVFEDVGKDFAYTQIWIENADGSNVRKLVSDDFTDGGAALSPDGRQVVFTRILTLSLEEALADPRLIDQILVVNVDGTDLHRIETGPATRCGDGVAGDAWSPDGRRIAFERFCFDASANFVESGIWTANADGTAAIRATKTTLSSHTEDHRAGWSPDGKRLAFARIDTSVAPERSAIFTVAIDGTDLQQVTDWSLDANDPDWSPDGSLIVFNSPAEPAVEQNIYTIHPDGTGPTELTTYSEMGQGTYHPSWSPDGTQILFSHSPATGGWADFFVMDRDGSDLHAVARTDMHENHGFWGPDPSP
jgi:Tol biopolymer transport system component